MALFDDATSLSNSIEEQRITTEESETQDIIDDEIIDDRYTPGKSKSIGFTVRFEDGFVVSQSTAKDTMVEVFRHIGFEKVAQFKGRTFKGFSLVDRRKRMDSNGVWQENVGNGWYVYTNMSNDTKKIMIQRVATSLNIKLSIFDNFETGVSTKLPLKGRKPRAVFSLNGRPPQDKRNSVLTAVKVYTKNHPRATFNELKRSFPDTLQGSYGVIRSLDEIEERRKIGQQVDNRYFLDPSDILTSADGVQFAVCNQWGDQFQQFQEYVKNFSWSLEEV